LLCCNKTACWVGGIQSLLKFSAVSHSPATKLSGRHFPFLGSAMLKAAGV